MDMHWIQTFFQKYQVLFHLHSKPQPLLLLPAIKTLTIRNDFLKNKSCYHSNANLHDIIVN